MRTIPIEIANELGLYHCQKLELEVKGGKIIITPVKPVVEK